jgi:hypothetical protein
MGNGLNELIPRFQREKRVFYLVFAGRKPREAHTKNGKICDK